MPERKTAYATKNWVTRVRHLPRTAQRLYRETVGRVSFRLFREYSFLPQEVLFFLTYRCNLRCKTCGQWGERGYVIEGVPDILKDELPFEALKPTFDVLASFHPRVILCGGEIFLYPQWKEVVGYLAEKGLGTTIITNGTRLKDNASFLVSSQVEQILLSLDGISEVHDRIRGNEGTFQRMMDGLHAVLEEREARGAYFPRLVVNATVSDLNYAMLPTFVKTLESTGVDCITLLHFNFISQRLWEEHDRHVHRRLGTSCPHWKGFVYDPSDLDMDRFISIVNEIKGTRYSIPVQFMPDYEDEEIRNYYVGGRFHPKRARGVCKGPWNTANVLPNGDVSPCLDVVVGNIQEDGGFREAWNGSAMRRFRRLLKQGRLLPVCTRCCTYYRF